MSLAAGLILGCSSDVTPPGYNVIGGIRSHAPVEPLPFLRAVGCKATTADSVGPGSIMLRTASGIVFFDCAGIDRATVRRAERTFRDSLGASIGAAEEEGGYFYDYWETTTCQDGQSMEIGTLQADADGNLDFVDQSGNEVYASGYYPGAYYYVTYTAPSSCTTTSWFEGTWDGPPPDVPSPDAATPGSVSGPVAPPPPPPPADSTIVGLALTPGSLTAAVGDYTPAVSVTATYADGHTGPLSLDQVTWSASPSDVLSPDDLGTVHALAGGTGTLTAMYSGPLGSAEGSSRVTVDDPDSPCDRSVAGCLVDPNSSEMRYMAQALALADTTNPYCAQALEGEREAFSENVVYMGADSIPDGSLAHSAVTFTVTDPTTHQVFLVDQHFDTDDYDAARADGTAGLQAFARLMLHEGLHVMGYSHPDTDGGGGVYTTPPFDLTNPGSSAHGCLKR